MSLICTKLTKVGDLNSADTCPDVVAISPLALLS